MQAVVFVYFGLWAVERAVAGVEAVGFAEVPDDTRVAGHGGAVAFFLAFVVAAAQLVVADAPAADEGEVFARAHHEFAVSTGFVQGLFA